MPVAIWLQVVDVFIRFLLEQQQQKNPVLNENELLKKCENNQMKEN